MSLQFVPYAMRVKIQNPLAKLIFIKLVSNCDVDGYVDIEVGELAIFSGATVTEVIFALEVLWQLGALAWYPDDPAFTKTATFFCILPTAKEVGPRQPINAEIVDRLKSEFGDTCAACGCQGYEDREAPLAVDHIIPRSYGGTNDYINLQLLCRRCNSRKHNKIGNVNFLEGKQ